VIVIALLALTLVQSPDGDGVPPTGSIEGRPAPQHLSSLQPLIDRAQPGDRIEVPDGVYDGDLLVDRTLTLIGNGRVTLRGSGHGSVVRIRAGGVTIEGLVIDGRSSGDLGRDTSGIHVAAPRAVIRRCRIEQALFGIYLRAADDAIVEDNVVVGIPGRDPGEIGSGIHLWNSQRFQIHRNVIKSTRDGFYIQSSSRGFIRGNRAHDLRYGLHYMYSDDNRFEGNTFHENAAGAALMFSSGLTLTRNRFVTNRSQRAYGLLLQSVDNTFIDDNEIAGNTLGVFLENGHGNRVFANRIAANHVGIRVSDSSDGNVFADNRFA